MVGKTQKWKKADFQRLSHLRLIEAEVLLKNQCYSGAYYLMGYAVECALKACISKNTEKHDFPPSREIVTEIYNHDLHRLMKISGLTPKHQKKCKQDPVFERNWAIVRDWSEQSRYNTFIDEKDCLDLHSAIVDIKSGVLPWLSKLW